MFRSQRRHGWTAVFLATTGLTSVTGFCFPRDHLLPSHIVGILSLVVLAVAILALYGYQLVGSWRWLYVASAGWDVFWRESLHDGLYGNAVNLVRSGQRSRARSIGSQASVQVEWQVKRHTTLTAVYSHFIAGPFLRETGPGWDVDYASAWLTYKF
jgi:hypothetical protein